jgi:tetratricopeptide (TPR) repeat protein
MKKKIILVVLAALYLGYSVYKTKKTRELEFAISYSAVGAGTWDKTIRLCDKLPKYIPNHPDVNYEKAIALMQLGKYQESIEPCNLVIKYHYIAKRSWFLNNAYYKRARSLVQLGRLEEALESCDLAIKHGYDHRSVYFLRNEILMALGRFPG